MKITMKKIVNGIEFWSFFLVWHHYLFSDSPASLLIFCTRPKAYLGKRREIMIEMEESRVERGEDHSYLIVIPQITNGSITG